MTERTITRGCVLLREWLSASAGRSQATLAEDLNVTAAAVSNIVTGRNSPGMELAAMLQARTRGAIRVTDWLDETAGARVERMARLMET